MQMQQGPGSGELPQGIDGYELMVDNFADQAKIFWRSMGPQGEPMVRGVEAWAEMQRALISWMRLTQGASE
jgi:hypothetical protein